MRMLSLVVVLAILTAVRSGQAQETESPNDSRLVHLDTPIVPDRSAWAGRLDVRVFGSKEDIAYTSLSASYGLGNGWEAIARGTLAERKSFVLPGGGAIRHGGNDFELLAKYRYEREPRLAGLIGVVFTDTPAQRDTFLTLGGAAFADVGANVTAYLNPRAVFIKNNTLVGIGLGLRARLSDNLALVGDWTPVVAGDNTRDTTTGALKRSDVFGAALRYASSNGLYSADLGFTNGTGLTTGAGLTPGLGGSGAFYLALTARW